MQERQVTVDVSNLRREFQTKGNKIVALESINLHVRSGEIFGVLGPNGAGKTTFIRILATLLLPTSGSAKVLGFDVANEPGRVRSLINMASGAERAGYDFISARGNLWFFSQLYGIKTNLAKKRIEELSEQLELTKYLDAKFYTLSTGYRQRVTIARAFINDPKVVLLDEPTVGLDVMTAQNIREFLKIQASEYGRTILLATHNMAEVDAICERVAIIDKGRILALDTPSDLKRSLGAPALVMEMTPVPQSLEFLANLPGIKGVTSKVDEERAVARVQAVIEDEMSVDRAIRAVRESGQNLISSWRQQPTLEEVFVALVGRGFTEREREVGP